MQDPRTKALIEAAERYSVEAGIGISIVSREMIGDTSFIRDLKEGRSCRFNTVIRAAEWLNARWPAGVEWPADLPRPDNRSAA